MIRPTRKLTKKPVKGKKANAKARKALKELRTSPRYKTIKSEMAKKTSKLGKKKKSGGRS